MSWLRILVLMWPFWQPAPPTPVPAVAIRPVRNCGDTTRLVDVDLIVVNRVRRVLVTRDARGRLVQVPSEVWYVSFYDFLRVPAIPGLLVNPVVMVHRGWRNCFGLGCAQRCSGGWVIDTNDGFTVVGTKLFFIDSPYDWELRHRAIYLPIRAK